MDIEGREVKCTVCGKKKKPVGRSAPVALCGYYCEDNILDPENSCPGYRQDPQAGWLFHGEKWSESFGDFPLPVPSECYVAIHDIDEKA